MSAISRDQIVYALNAGNIIWRPLRVHNGIMHPELSTVPVIDQEGKHSFVRTLIDGYGQFIPEPVVNPYRGKGKQYGVITFLRAPLQECWTHLVVVNGGRGGNCLTVIPECLPDVPAYITWRLQVESLYADRSITGAQELAEIVRDYECPGLRPDRKRIQIWGNYSDGYNTL